MSALGHEGGRLATVDELIAAAGVSRATFYNHFDGREKLLEAVSFQLSHDFNSSLDRTLGPGADPAARAATWIRHYLHRVRAEPDWGWTLVNVSFSGSRLLGEESYNAARSNLEVGCETGVFKIADRDAVLDLTLGGVLAAAISILRGLVSPAHPEATAYAALRAYGVSEAKAKRLIDEPLRAL